MRVSGLARRWWLLLFWFLSSFIHFFFAELWTRRRPAWHASYQALGWFFLHIYPHAFAGLLEVLLFLFYIDEVLKDGNLTLYITSVTFDGGRVGTPVVGGA